MTYASLELLSERHGERMLVELTDRDTPRTGAVVEDVVDRVLADTDAVIDGYIAGRYRLPLAQTPALLVDLALSIALYKLHRSSVPPKIEQDYKEALAQLREIAKGTIKLPIAGIEPPSSGAQGVRSTDRARDMTPDNLRGFI